MAAHFIYQFILCAIQSIMVFSIFMLFVGGNDLFAGNPIVYFITIFLITYASDAMSFVLSSVVPNPIVAMTFMPLLLLVQLVMAGVLFELGDMSELVAAVTISKWGMIAFGVIGDITTLPSAMEEKLSGFMEHNELIGQSNIDKYSGNAGDIIVCWMIFILFIVAFYFLSVLALKMTTRKIKK